MANPRDIPAEADIACPAETIFDLIVDLRGQGRWLSVSSAFRGTQSVSENPAKLGTTYREPGPLGVRNGIVTELERPAKITFHQPMTLRLHAGTVDVTMRYTLEPRGVGTHVERHVTLDVPFSLKLLQPVIVRAFRVESARTLLSLKVYADKLGRTDD